jgi:pimeloyl-ACP methyl ester carboxylesterase
MSRVTRAAGAAPQDVTTDPRGNQMPGASSPSGYPVEPSVNGHALAYVECGDGEPVVFVHGDISDLRMWLAQLDAFAAAGCRAVAYSRRHAWPNADREPDGPDPLLGHVADLEAFLDARGLAPAHLVGNSFGASICLTLAARRPALVRSLVVQEPPAVELLIDAPPRPRALLGLLARRPRMAVALLRFGLGTMDPAARALARGDLDRALAGFCAGILGRDGERALRDSRRQQMRDNVGAFRAHLTGALPPSADEVRSIDAPALLVTGQRSHPTLRRLTTELHRLLPHSRTVEIADAAHFANEDQPDTYNQAVLAFLGRQPRRLELDT